MSDLDLVAIRWRRQAGPAIASRQDLEEDIDDLLKDASRLRARLKWLSAFLLNWRDIAGGYGQGFDEAAREMNHVIELDNQAWLAHVEERTAALQKAKAERG